MFKKNLMIFLICVMSALLLISPSISAVQACTYYEKNSLPPQLASAQILAAAHWNITVNGIQGGWIFAALGRDPGFGNQAWLYVSGFHPSGIMHSPSNITFSGTNSTVNLTNFGNILSVSAMVNFTTVMFDASGNPVTTFTMHAVNVNWTLVQTAKTYFNYYDRNWPYAKDTMSDTSAFVSIDIYDSVMHTTFPTSDWATIGILNPQSTLAVAHWIIDDPKAGGWVFAAAGRSVYCKDAWLYVAGYHPAGAFGRNSATIFEALNTTDVNLMTTRNMIKIPTLTTNFTQYQFVQATPTVTYANHAVSVNWTLTPQPRTIYMQWQPAFADAAINTGGSNQHNVVTTSSFAMAKMTPMFGWR